MADKLIFDPETGELISSGERVRALHRVKGRAVRPVPKTPLAQGQAVDVRTGAETLRFGIAAEKERVLAQMQARGSELAELGPSAVALLNVPSLAEAAEKAVTAVGYSEALGRELTVLIKTGSASERALRILGHFGPQASALSAGLLTVALEDEASKAGQQALAAIGFDRDGRAAFERCVRLATPDERARLMQLAETVGEGATGLLPFLVRRIDDSDPEVREAAQNAFSTIGYRANAHEAVMRFLRHGKPERRMLMLRLLRNEGSRARALAPEIFRLLSDGDHDVAEAARKALNATGASPECLPVVEGLLAHPQLEKRLEGLHWLETFPHATRTSVLVRLLDDPHFPVRDQAEALLRRDGLDLHASGEIACLLREGSTEARHKLYDLLAALGPEAKPVAPLVAAGLTQNDPALAEAARHAFREIGFTAGCTEIFAQMLRSTRQHRKLVALEILAESDAEGAPVLREVARCLGDDDAVVRDAAVEALIAIGFDESCLPVIARLIAHANRDFRLAAIEAVGRCGMPAAVAANYVRQRLRDRDAEVGAAARATLIRIEQG